MALQHLRKQSSERNGTEIDGKKLLAIEVLSKIRKGEDLLGLSADRQALTMRILTA